MKKLTHREKIYSLAAIFLMIDEFVKIIVRAKLTLHKEVAVIPKFFYLYHTTNTGAAFSYFSSHTTMLIVITFICIFILDRCIKSAKTLSKVNIFTFGMMLGGIFGNLIDRLVYHGVTDYLLFIFNHKAFPVFNIADVLITVGSFTYIISFFIEEIKDLKNKKAKKALKRKEA